MIVASANGGDLDDGEACPPLLPNVCYVLWSTGPSREGEGKKGDRHGRCGSHALFWDLRWHNY